MTSMRTSAACQRCLMYLRPSESLLRPASYSTRLWRPAAPPAGLASTGRRSIVSAFRDSNNKEPPTPSAMVRNNVLPTSPMSGGGEVGSGVLAGDNTRVLLQPDNLFHSMDQSPSSEIRKRAKLIKAIALCPHPEHRHTSESQRIKFTCPECGVPTYCSEEHWAEDYDNHLLICDALREANEDDHDLRSGRFFPEFDYPGDQIEEQLINMTNWDTLLYTRNFKAINGDRQLRQATKLLTYPLTVASFLHELSPYGLRNRLTTEGLRSLSALRYTLHPPLTGAGQEMKNIQTTPPPVRLFILGARAESSLPRDVWYQLSYMFPRSTFHLIFIGPESMQNRENEYPLPDRTASNPFGAIVERVSYHMKISTFVEYYHTLHDAGAFAPYDPYFDCFVLFHPGLGHPGSAPEWENTLPRMLETKIPILCTGYTKTDMARDVEWVKDVCRGEFDMLLEPGENRFKSLRWDINDADPTDLSQGNWGIWSFRGKRYEATTREEPTV